jgi:hypothetical protein
MASNREELSSPSFYDNPFSDSLMDRSFHSVMTPWELEFREGNLRKKSVKKVSKCLHKRREKV